MTPNKKIYNHTIGCDYSESNDIEESIDDAIIDANNVYNYFNFLNGLPI